MSSPAEPAVLGSREHPYLAMLLAAIGIATALCSVYAIGSGEDPRFWEWYTRTYLLPWDYTSSAIDLLLHFMCLWRLWRPDKPFYIITLIASLAMTLTQVLMARYHRELYLRMRPGIVAVRRLLACMAMSWAMYHTFKPGESAKGLVRLMLGTSCAFSTCAHCMMLRERFRYSFVYNAMAAAMLMSSSSGLCDDAMRHVSHSKELVAQLASVLQDMAHVALTLFGIRTAPLTAIAARDKSTVMTMLGLGLDDKHANDLCVAEMRTIQLVLGVIVPLYITHIMDTRARHEYQRAMRQRRGPRAGGAAEGGADADQQQQQWLAGLGGGPVALAMTVLAPQAFICATVMAWLFFTLYLVP